MTYLFSVWLGEVPMWSKQRQTHSLLGTLVPTKHILPLNVTGWNLAIAVSNSPLWVEGDSSQCGMVGYWWMIQGTLELSSHCWCHHWSLEVHAALQHSLVLGVKDRYVGTVKWCFSCCRLWIVVDFVHCRCCEKHRSQSWWTNNFILCILTYNCFS